MDHIEKKIRTVNRYQGIIVGVQVDNVELEGGSRTMREVVDHPGGVAIIPIDNDGNVYCVRQFRYPIGQTLLEVPAGKLEGDEQPLACAVRELSEETGISAGKYDYLGRVLPSPGFCREALHVYLARDLTFGKAHPDQNEFLNLEKYTLDELYRLVMSGELEDGKTIIAVLKAKLFIEEQGD